MSRQASTPVPYDKTMRSDNGLNMTSGFAGKVIPLGYIPMIAGDSLSGRVGIDLKMAEMPRPLLNAVAVNVQVWAVPKGAFPQFPGRDELNHSMTGQVIKSLGAADRTPPPFFTTVNGANLATAAGSEFFKTLGLHFNTGDTINTDLIDAFSVIYNFRLAAHSSRLTRRQYSSESIANSTTLPPAFWPPGRFAHVVPDYEQALITGAFDLDVLAPDRTDAARSASLDGDRAGERPGNVQLPSDDIEIERTGERQGWRCGPRRYGQAQGHRRCNRLDHGAECCRFRRNGCRCRQHVLGRWHRS